MSIKDITIVITSFKSDLRIKKCLNSIDRECKVINIENSDNIEHKKKIEQEFSNVKCILAGKNLGYGKANNLGLNEVKTKYALILNPDTELFTSTLENFLLLAKMNPDFAIIGPNIKEDKKEENLEIEKSKEGVNIPDLFSAQSVKGYAMFLNLKEFKQVGFFDENFFIYLEEIDLCKRLLEKGKKIYWCPSVLIFHEGGKSHDSSVDKEMELSRNWHWMWSTFYFNKKYRGFFISLMIVIPKLSSAILKFLLYSLLSNKSKRDIYYQRYSGLINSIMGKDSWYRPKI